MSRHRLLRAPIGALAAGAALSGCAGPVRNAHVPQPVRAVVTSRLLGRWYEIARYPDPWENGCDDATVDYALRRDGLISVVDACRRGPPKARVQRSEGSAALAPDSGGAKLRERFLHGFVRRDVWVLNHDDAYSWAILGDPSGRRLRLLARTPLEGPERDALLRRAAELGYPTAPLHLTRQPDPDAPR